MLDEVEQRWQLYQNEIRPAWLKVFGGVLTDRRYMKRGSPSTDLHLAEPAARKCTPHIVGA